MERQDAKGPSLYQRAGPLQQAWDMLVAVGSVIAAIDIPARLVLGYQSLTPVTHLDVAITVIFTADMLRHLRDAVKLRKRSSSVMARSMAAEWRWFAIDLCGAIPFARLPGPDLLQLIRLVKLTRVAERMQRWQRTQFHNPNVVRLLLFPFWLILGVHWIACGWLILRAAPADMDAPTRYLNALYWAVTTLTTVGYGDICPSTKPEVMYAMATMILGVGVYGYVIGNVAGLLANIDPARVRHQEAVSKVTAFMRYRQVPGHLQTRILDYYEYLWEKRLGYDESAAISELPPSLRTEVYLYLNREIIEKVPLFQGGNDDFIRSIVLEMRPVVFMPGDNVVRAGDSGDEMYFISRGTVQVESGDGKQVYATLGDGDFFGEMALLLDQPRTATVRAMDYCDVYSLSKTAFDHVLVRHPDVAERVKQIAKQRETELKGRGSSG